MIVRTGGHAKRSSRAAIVLRYWRGRSPEQIAAELAVPHNTVRSRLQRGLERLRAQLDAKFGERSRCRGALALLAKREDTALAAATGGGALLVLGVAMKTKLIFGAALLIAAAFTVPILLDASPAIARTEPPAAAPIVAAPAGTDENTNAAPDREAVTAARAVPAPRPKDRQLVPPLKVPPWLARREPEIHIGVRGSLRTDASGRVLEKKCVPGPHRIIVASGPYGILHEQDVLVTAGPNSEVVVRLPKRAAQFAAAGSAHGSAVSLSCPPGNALRSRG